MNEISSETAGRLDALETAVSELRMAVAASQLAAKKNDTAITQLAIATKGTQ